MPRHVEVQFGVVMFDGTDFDGNRHDVKLERYPPGQWHNLAGGTDEFTNRAESMVWHLPEGVTVTFATLPNGGGRQLAIRDGGADINLKETEGFEEEIESWRWDRSPQDL